MVYLWSLVEIHFVRIPVFERGSGSDILEQGYCQDYLRPQIVVNIPIED